MFESRSNREFTFSLMRSIARGVLGARSRCMNTIHTYTHKIKIQTRICGCFNLGSHVLDSCQGKALVIVEFIMDLRIQLLWGLGVAAVLRLYLGAAHT